MSSSYQKALDSGYSPEEISSFLSKKDPKYAKALQSGYSPEEIDSFLQNQAPSESWMGKLNRNIVRGTVRGAETVLGTPRALGDLAHKLVPEKLLGAAAEKVGLREPVEKALKFTKEYSPHNLFPKSEDIREDVTKYLFGEKLEPKNEWERKADDLVSDFAALAIPMPGAQLKLLKPAILALGANVVSEGIGQLGGSEKQKAYGKIGTILAGSMINPRSAEKLKTDLYAQANKARPDNAVANTKPMEKSARALQENLMKGDPNAPSKNKSFNLLQVIMSKIKNNEIAVNELEELKRNVNEARSSLYDEFKSDKIGRKTAKRNLDAVSKVIDEGLNEYGKTNPIWESFYRPANEVHGAIAQSHKARNIIGRTAKKYGLHSILPVLGLSHYGGPAAITAAATTAAVGGAGLFTGEIISKIMKSPTLRKHYFNLIQGGLKEDTTVIASNLRKLEKELSKED